jgi:2-dehydro-3-deoxyphosphogluconate aldolase / (4S)-4-hydroxy-2-oxoglutarate aldolase
MTAYKAIQADRVVAVIRAERVAEPPGLAKTLAASGIRCVEFTFTIPNAAAVVAEAAASSDAFVGAGTVLNPGQAVAAMDAGASFVIAPVVATDVVRTCTERKIPVFLGGFIPTEIVAANAAGATAVKLFPARIRGPDYIRDLRGPFPDIAIIPSAGINEGNARAYFDAGAVAVYAGSGLAPPDLVASGAHSEIARRAERFVAALG